MYGMGFQFHKHLSQSIYTRGNLSLNQDITISITHMVVQNYLPRKRILFYFA